jgi:RNA polymerase sigma factor (sigma-70 family)
MKRLDDHDEAKDIVGEAFIATWGKHSTLHHPKQIKSYLYTCVRNSCMKVKISRVARLKREMNFVDEFELVTPSHEESVIEHEQMLIKSEVYGDLHNSIKKLPKECRKIFRRLYIQGKTVAETAKELKIKISTVKNQKARGIMLLRKQMIQI